MLVNLTLGIQIIVSFYYHTWLLMYAIKKIPVYHTVVILCNKGGFEYKKNLTLQNVLILVINKLNTQILLL